MSQQQIMEQRRRSVNQRQIVDKITRHITTALKSESLPYRADMPPLRVRAALKNILADVKSVDATCKFMMKNMCEVGPVFGHFRHARTSTTKANRDLKKALRIVVSTRSVKADYEMPEVSKRVMRDLRNRIESSLRDLERAVQSLRKVEAGTEGKVHTLARSALSNLEQGLSFFKKGVAAYNKEWASIW